MTSLSFSKRDVLPIDVLCLGAHADDIEIGCGGTLLMLPSWMPQIRFHWVVLSATEQRRGEAERSAHLFTEGSESQLILKQFRDGYFPYNGEAIKEFFEELKGIVNPHLIFTHWRGDAHQDHQLVAELTWNTFRNHLILEYEVPKYDGDTGRPNLFVPLERSIWERKIELLLDAFESQRDKRWFDGDTFSGLMRLRGMEANAPSGFAEAFHARKVVFSPCG
jgi:LmbE family N-acetylglucosaminyl deacetylase